MNMHFLKKRCPILSFNAYVCISTFIDIKFQFIDLIHVTRAYNLWLRSMIPLYKIIRAKNDRKLIAMLST